MSEEQGSLQKMVQALRERAKELNCIYEVEKLLKDSDRDLDQILQGIVDLLPPAFQYSEYSRARIVCGDKTYVSPNFVETAWTLRGDIVVDDEPAGKIEIFYTEPMLSEAGAGPFLKDEVILLGSIVGRVGDFIKQRNLRQLVTDLQEAETEPAKKAATEWQFALDLLRRTDQNLYYRISRKMLNYLCWTGVEEAKAVIKEIEPGYETDPGVLPEGDNVPQQVKAKVDRMALSRRIFDIANRNLPEETILMWIQKWMLEDRASFFFRTLTNMHTSLGDISDAMRRFVHLDPIGIELSESTKKGVLVALLRRLITSNLNYIMIAKNYVDIRDFYDLIQHLIFPVGSHGLIGGKGAGLFLAMQILRKHAVEHSELAGITVPKTWYVTSDYLLTFMDFNNLEDVTEQKYKDMDQVRQEYPHVIELFKNSHFPPEFVRAVSTALDDLGEKPIIVRSSSLLEDSLGSAFSGKYKSLFLANQGTKEKRLTALLDAVAEVYSSTFGADPIGYRAERNLIDFHEEMGIIIQQVVGTQIGRYFLPAYAGVAFSNNEFRWSSRIRRDDGLLRLVPGLGTRAVDRLSDDYPILIAPGQPGLRVNVSLDEVVRYSPRKIDLINLDTNSFETMDIREFFGECGDHFPATADVVSLVQDDRLVAPSRFQLQAKQQEAVVTFDGLVNRTDFIARIRKILRVLQDVMEIPVDIEFASDGKTFYLLQCRPQSGGPYASPTPIPRNLPDSEILFSAKRYISNGQVPDITHIVYVDPQRYSEVRNHADLLEVGRAVSALNQLLPRRRFILMGPGRWGSRGDIKLGVSVTYSDINNTAVLIEIARKKGNYVPDLSFGTHFFQDLVEASIRYLPLYPDDPGILFHEQFLSKSPNILADVAPEFARLAKVLRVIDVPATRGGKILKVAINAEMEIALGFFADPSGGPEPPKKIHPFVQSAPL